MGRVSGLSHVTAYCQKLEDFIGNEASKQLQFISVHSVSICLVSRVVAIRTLVGARQCSESCNTATVSVTRRR